MAAGLTPVGDGKVCPEMDFTPLGRRDDIRPTNDRVREDIAVKHSILHPAKEVDSQNSTNTHSKTSESSADLEEPRKDPEPPTVGERGK